MCAGGGQSTVYASHPMYPGLMWPLLLPEGTPLPYVKPADAEDAAANAGDEEEAPDLPSGRLPRWSIPQMTMALVLQPECGDDKNMTILLPTTLPTKSPYHGEDTIQRPFSRVQLCGKLGDEASLSRPFHAEVAAVLTCRCHCR